MNLPNKLTTARIVLTIPFIYFLGASQTYGQSFRYIACGIFVVAGLTDWFDGHLARKKNMVTDFGKLMDPLADRILVISALVMFVSLGWLAPWMAIVVIAREFLIGGIRTLAAADGNIIPAGTLGKFKTSSQMLVIFITLLFADTFWNMKYNEYMMVIPVILTVWSGIEYSSKAKHYFMNHN
ncbi:MAG: CDP-diacylglycerol--glycerol-3-phosphate 3-phosphatidyltransferase [Fusobacteriaceae bacterium]